MFFENPRREEREKKAFGEFPLLEAQEIFNDSSQLVAKRIISNGSAAVRQALGLHEADPGILLIWPVFDPRAVPSRRATCPNARSSMVLPSPAGCTLPRVWLASNQIPASGVAAKAPRTAAQSFRLVGPPVEEACHEEGPHLSFRNRFDFWRRLSSLRSGRALCESCVLLREGVVGVLEPLY